MKTKIFFLVVALTTTSITLNAQKETNTRKRSSDTSVSSHNSFESSQTIFERNFKLDHDSNTQDVTVDIPDSAEMFQLKVFSTVNQGKLTIEIYDPKGRKQGNYTVGLQTGSDRETSGRITKSFNQPQAGIWTVKVIPIDVTGNIWSEVVIYE